MHARGRTHSSFVFRLKYLLFRSSLSYCVEWNDGVPFSFVRSLVRSFIRSLAYFPALWLFYVRRSQDSELWSSRRKEEEEDWKREGHLSWAGWFPLSAQIGWISDWLPFSLSLCFSLSVFTNASGIVCHTQEEQSSYSARSSTSSPRLVSSLRLRKIWRLPSLSRPHRGLVICRRQGRESCGLSQSSRLRSGGGSSCGREDEADCRSYANHVPPCVGPPREGVSVGALRGSLGRQRIAMASFLKGSPVVSDNKVWT